MLQVHEKSAFLVAKTSDKLWPTDRSSLRTHGLSGFGLQCLGTSVLADSSGIPFGLRGYINLRALGLRVAGRVV